MDLKRLATGLIVGLTALFAILAGGMWLTAVGII